MRYLTIRKFASESGYTEAAVRSKISSGVWVKDVVWRRAPDGRILIDVQGVEAWVELGKAEEIRPVIRPVKLTHSAQSLSPPPLER